jgi:hypothetical protein
MRSLLILTIFAVGCEESLPLREEPVEFLRADIYMLTGVVVFRNHVAVTVAGSFFLTVKNLHDEVLQARALVKADIDVAMRDMSANRALVHANKDNLHNSWILQSNQITLGPDTAAQLIKQWDHRTADGIPFWEFVPLTQKFTARGEPFLESEPVNFVAKAEVQVFENVPSEKTEQIEFSLIYNIFD